MAKVEWRKNALADLDQIIGYIDQFDPEAAIGIGFRLFALGESLCDFPNRSRPARDGTREMVTVSPYILSYEASGGIVAILGIRHSARLVD